MRVKPAKPGPLWKFFSSIWLAVGLMLTLFTVYRMGDLMDSNSEVTMVKTNAQGEREIIVETGEAREVHHFALLLGFGAAQTVATVAAIAAAFAACIASPNPAFIYRSRSSCESHTSMT